MDMDTLEMNPNSGDTNDGQNESAKSAKEIVMEYIQAAERREFKSARTYLKDDVSYVSPINSFNRADAYLKYFESLHLPKFDIKKIISDGDDVCVLHETTLTTPLLTSFASVWFQVVGGKIGSIKVLFDPRPFVSSER
jgi:SnoaL-like domain